MANQSTETPDHAADYQHHRQRAIEYIAGAVITPDPQRAALDASIGQTHAILALAAAQAATIPATVTLASGFIDSYTDTLGGA